MAMTVVDRIDRQLKKEAAWAGWATATLLALTVAAVAVGALTRYKEVYTAALPLLIGVGIGLYARRSLKADRLLAGAVIGSVQPVRLALTPLGATDLVHCYAVLRRPGETSGRGRLVALNTTRYKRLPRTTAEVEIYLDPDREDGRLVADAGGRAFPGRLMTPDRLVGNARRFRNVYWGLVFCFALVMLYWIGEQALGYSRGQDALALARDSESWPGVEAEVVSASVESVRISRGRLTVAGYEARVQYRYRLGGREYEGSRIYFGYLPGRDEARARELVEGLSPGGAAVVRRRPGDPSVSTLYPGREEACRKIMSDARVGMIIAAIGLVVPPIGFWIAYRILVGRRNRAIESWRDGSERDR